MFKPTLRGKLKTNAVALLRLLNSPSIRKDFPSHSKHPTIAMKLPPIIPACIIACLTILPARGVEHPPGQLAKESKSEQPVTRKLREIIIPSISVEGVTIRGMGDFLSLRSKELASDKVPLQIACASVEIGDIRIDSLRMTNMPVGVALAYVAVKTGTRMVVAGGVIRFLAADNQAGSGLAPENFANKQAAPPTDPAKIIIPEVKLENATLEGAIDMVRMRSMENDPTGRGINIILLMDAAKAPKVKSLKLENQSARKALEAIAKATGTRLVFASHAVEFWPLASEKAVTTGRK